MSSEKNMRLRFQPGFSHVLGHHPDELTVEVSLLGQKGAWMIVNNLDFDCPRGSGGFVWAKGLLSSTVEAAADCHAWAASVRDVLPLLATSSCRR